MSNPEINNIFPLEYSELFWSERTNAALEWVKRSIQATGGNGSAHSWRPVFGWHKAYPETTGYLIPTLMDYALLLEDESLTQLAEKCGNWLITIQLPCGAFPGLLVGNNKPSVFNTAQILFGLARMAHSAAPADNIVSSLERATKWLLDNLESDFSWQKHAYIPGYSPAYYTRAILGVLEAQNVLKLPGLTDAMHGALDYYADKFLSPEKVGHWGFRPDEPAFTHTIAYTLEGFLACSQLFSNKKMLDKTIACLDKLLLVRSQNGGRLAGRYSGDWEGDYQFICPTGHAQLSILYFRLFTLTGKPQYQAAALEILSEVIDCQKLAGPLNSRGALPGSRPIWGAYLPFRYPNWAAKFFLDAMTFVAPDHRKQRMSWT